MLYGSLQHNMRIDADQFAIMIGIAIAGARRARLDVAHHRTGIAADLVANNGSRGFGRHEQAWPRAALDHTPFSNAGCIVRIQTILRAPRKPVKRLSRRKISAAE
jgi:hypothetical protein